MLSQRDKLSVEKIIGNGTNPLIKFLWHQRIALFKIIFFDMSKYLAKPFNLQKSMNQRFI